MPCLWGEEQSSKLAHLYEWSTAERIGREHWIVSPHDRMPG